MPLGKPTKEFISSTEQKFGEMVLFNRRQFEIPFNQRPFTWKTTHLADFFTDFLSSMKSGYEESSSPKWRQRITANNSPHFFGAFIFVEDESGVYEVFDGQQRLTTSILFMACLREQCQILIDRAPTSQVKTDASTLAGMIYRWLVADPSVGEIRPRIVPDTELKSLFYSITDNVYDKDRKAAFEAQGIDVDSRVNLKRLHDAYTYLRGKCEAECNGLTDQELFNFLQAASDTISQSFLCLSVISKNAFAYQVFNTLNARGLPLTEADKIKNAILMKASESDRQEIVNTWREVINQLPDQNMAEFLRRRHLGKFGVCKKDELFKKTSEHEINKISGTLLVKNWKKDAERVREILTGSTRSPVINRMLMDIFDILDISLAIIPLLTAHRRFMPKNLSAYSTIVRNILHFCFRELTINSQKTSWLEKQLCDLAIKIEGGTPLADLNAFLEEHSPDSQFISSFSTAIETRVKVQFYILYNIEKYMSGAAGMAPLPHSPLQHIEHVMPQKLSKAGKRKGEWIWARRHAKKHAGLINRIGNLLILESNINTDVSNYEFNRKQQGHPSTSSPKQGYIDSSMKLAKRLSDSTRWPSWGEDEIDWVQKRLALHANKIWEIS